MIVTDFLTVEGILCIYKTSYYILSQKYTRCFYGKRTLQSFILYCFYVKRIHEIFSLGTNVIFWKVLWLNIKFGFNDTIVIPLYFIHLNESVLTLHLLEMSRFSGINWIPNKSPLYCGHHMAPTAQSASN